MSTRSSEEIFRPDLAMALDQYDVQADAQNFIGLRIAPVLDVDDESGKFPVTPPESMLIDVDDERAANGDYGTVSGKTKWETFSTTEHGIEERCDKRKRSINRRYWDDELLAAQRTRDVVLRNQERRIVTAALAGAANTSAVATGSRWSVHATAAPYDDILLAKRGIRNACGAPGNVAVMEWDTFEDLRACEQILERTSGGTGGTDPKTISTQQAAIILGLDEIIVAESMKNTKNRGQDGVTFATIWPKDQVLVFRRNRGRDTRVAQFMRTIHWAEDGSKIGGTLESYYDPRRRSQYIRHRMDTEEKVLYGAAAYKLTNLAAAP
jgi:hypothetical protein